jgi:hypothetical protein
MEGSVFITLENYVFVSSCQVRIARRSAAFCVRRLAKLEVLLGITKEVKRDALLTCGGNRDTELTKKAER